MGDNEVFSEKPGFWTDLRYTNNLSSSKFNFMAKLPDETISTIFRLQQRLVALLDTATAAEYILLQQFGETEETMPELEAIDNVKERLRIPYNRLHRILQQVAESQPAATPDVLDFLYRTIDQGEAIADASEASIQEIKRSWNLPWLNSQEYPI